YAWTDRILNRHGFQMVGWQILRQPGRYTLIANRLRQLCRQITQFRSGHRSQPIEFRIDQYGSVPEEHPRAVERGTPPDTFRRHIRPAVKGKCSIRAGGIGKLDRLQSQAVAAASI